MSARILTFPPRAAYASPVAGKQLATGFGDLSWSGEEPQAQRSAAFFMPWCALYGRAGRESRKALPVLHRFANPFGSAHPFGDGERFVTRTGAHTMTSISTGASAPTIFNFRSTEVRTLVIDGEAWFVASDVAKALGHGDARHMTRILDDDEQGLQIVETLGGRQELGVINESGLYHAVLKSRKPEAKPFRKWVTSEVLPAIRKTGVYRAPAHKETSDLPDLFASHAAAMRFAMDYVTALERHTTDPASNAKPVWSEAEATKLADGLVHAWMLRANRWLLAFGSDGRPQLTMIDPCSSVISPDKEADLKALIGNHVPMHLIPLVLHEAAERVRLCQSNRRAA